MDEITKFCPHCQRHVPLSGWYKNRARSDGLAGHCIECHAEINTLARQRARRRALDALGGKCARCGYDTDERALQIDHIDGRDGKARENLTAAFYDRIVADPSRFQCLCANCNVIKRIEESEHRHVSTYRRDVPTEILQGPGRHNPDANRRRSETNRKWKEEHPEEERDRKARGAATRAAFTPEQRAEISRKLREARTGLRKGPDGKMYRPE